MVAMPLHGLSAELSHSYTDQKTFRVMVWAWTEAVATAGIALWGKVVRGCYTAANFLGVACQAGCCMDGTELQKPKKSPAISLT